jgi:hypothetical protein
MKQSNMRPKCVILSNSQVEIMSNLTGQGCHPRLDKKYYPIMLNKSKSIGLDWQCHNPSFGLKTKARVSKGVSQEESSGITFHAPRSVRKCEEMNPHIPKWAPTLGVRVSMDFQIFRGWL